ncbi:MAG: hypothetical protein E7559_01880 [Ruminococcaceae bacterium]|nr:hypothetical protein [Oscillospiraceae bacterium]
MDSFIIAAKNKKTVFCAERTERGVTRIAAAVARDLRSITDARPCDIRVAGSSSPDNGACANADVVVCAGTVGQGSFIDTAAAEGIIDISAVKGKRECYLLSLVQYKGRDVLFVAGSDLLGTEYGLLRISELAGVSPWYYWADVTPKKSENVAIDRAHLCTVSKEPAIRLRGFFMNDEWPSLGGWATETFGGFNELFYERVFDLLLRLRGNFLWPAMWSAVFSEDGLAYPTASAELANELGITMGTSHHEPLFRAGEEFSHTMTDSNDCGYGADWSYYSNERGLYDFWTDSVQRNRSFTSLITVGMRGERDSKILGEDATLADNINLIKKTIVDQKRILRENGLADAPKVLALYKEVETYFYGDENTPGLDKWEELDDIMLLLSDDNFANTRTLPSDEMRNRPAGWGLYYHFDYHGDPISYEWVNSTPITKAWEQLTMAYEYGIRDLWVVNVGDLRPVELPLSYFLNLAFDYDEWSKINRTGEFLAKWTEQQFGGFCDADTLRNIEDILNGYTRLNGDRRPEATHADTFSLTEDDEARRELCRAIALETLTERTAAAIPAERSDAFYGLVSFPALASANLRKMMIYAGMYSALAGMRASCANHLHQLVQQCIARDKQLVRDYNETMAGGKWRHMMSSKHVAFVHWNDEDSDYPHTQPIETEKKSRMLVAVSGSVEAVSSGQHTLPVFTSTEQQCRSIFCLRTGEQPLAVRAKASDSWIHMEELKLECGATEYVVSVDWDKLKGSASGTITLTCGRDRVEVVVEAQRISLEGIPSGTFVESSGVVSMEAEHFTSAESVDGCGWQVIENYGKGLSSIKCLPNNCGFENPEKAPYTQYSFFINDAGEYTVTAVIAPTNNLAHGKGLRFAIIIDGGQPQVIDSLPEGYMAGYGTDPDWCSYVLNNCRRCSSTVTLSEGLHTLRFCQVDAGVVLQKLEIAKIPSRAFYGYRETFRAE